MSNAQRVLVETPMTMALRYRSLGWCVFPVREGTKRPLIEGWQNRASKEPAEFWELWRQHPKGGIAVHCGLSGLVVVDVDPRNGGDETFKALEHDRGPLWDMDCAIAQTGGGGVHYVFRMPEGVRLPAKLGPGVDLLHGNHYFIVEPSVHPSGRRYEWEISPFDLAELDVLPPEWGTPVDMGASTVDTSDALANLPNHPMEDTERNAKRVRSAAFALSADCPRPEWVPIIFAILSTGLPCAVTIADEWSQTAPDRYDANAFRALVRSFKEGRHRGTEIGPGTLFHLAKQAGWIDPTTATDFHGDADNAARFARKHKGQLLYVHSDRAWLKWGGARWERCERGEERAAAQQVATEGLNVALAAMRTDSTDRTRDNYRQALSVHRNLKRHDALLSIATTLPGMSIGNRGDLDADRMLLGVRNGVVNLRTGTLLAPDPAMLITRQAGAAFTHGMTCPMWSKFLFDAFEGDSDLIPFVQRAVGYALTGLVDEEVLFFLFGSGANGKSVFCNVIHAIFNDYAVNVRSALLTRDARGINTEGEREKNRLPGARLALINEVGSADLFDDARLKELVGRDPIGTRALYSESFEFLPTHHIFLRGNHQPGAMDSGDAFWRRMVLIPFKRQFTGTERVPDLERRILDQERDGVLKWMVDGCLEWQRVGLRIPDSIRQAVDEYRSDTDMLGQWLEECCRRERSGEVATASLFSSYAAFLQQAGMRAPSKAVFGRQMATRGFTPHKRNGQRLLRGVALREWGDDDEL